MTQVRVFRKQQAQDDEPAWFAQVDGDGKKELELGSIPAHEMHDTTLGHLAVHALQEKGHLQKGAWPDAVDVDRRHVSRSGHQIPASKEPDLTQIAKAAGEVAHGEDDHRLADVGEAVPGPAAEPMPAANPVAATTPDEKAIPVAALKGSSKKK